jgi:heat shock protein HspQ
LTDINIIKKHLYFFIDFYFLTPILIAMAIQKAKFSIGDIVKHKHFEFRGVIYDVDFEFNNSEEWYQSIPKNVRPRKDQPFYHLLAENDEITYEAYVSQQNLLMDDSEDPIKHPLIEEIFSGRKGSSYFKPSN